MSAKVGSDSEAVSTAGPGRRVHLLALLGYLLLALLVTYPAIAQFTSGVPGDLLADRDQNMWNLWWAKRSLLGLDNPFNTGFLYYPYGANLYYHTLALPLGVIGLLPQLLLGLPAAYNTVLITGFTLSGYAMFRLCLLWNHAGTAPLPENAAAAPSPTHVFPFAAFLGGFVFAFTPYTLDALKGQPEVLSLQWMPLFAEMWIRSVGGDSISRPASRVPYTAILAGLFLALAAYTNLYYAVYLVIFALAYLGYGLWRARRDADLAASARRLMLPAALSSGVALLLALPLLWGLAADRNNPRLAVAADPEHRLAHSADVLSFFAPPHDHLLFGTWQDRPGVNQPAIHDYLGLGYAALALSILGAVAAWRRPGGAFWVGLMVLALVLAMGPELQIGRNRTGVPLPFALFSGLPGIEAIAKPERFVVLARLCMGMLAAFGAATLLTWILTNRRPNVQPRWAAVGLLAALLIELPIHPRYMQPLEIPSALSALPAGESVGLMELPFATQQSETTGRRMLYQTEHELPIMGGYLARRYNSPIIDSCGPFWGFISPLDVPREDVASPLVVNRPLEVMTFYRIGYIALYARSGSGSEPVDPDLLDAFNGILDEVAIGGAANPLSADSTLSLYSVKQADLPAAQPSFHLGAGWYPVEQSNGVPFRWVQEGRGSLCVFSPRTVTATLSLEATAFAQERGITISRGGDTLFSGRLPAAAFTLLELPSTQWQAGITQLDIISEEPGTSPSSLAPGTADNRLLTLGIRAVTIEELP